MVNRRHFFKVMIPGRYRTRLQIPPEFVKHISYEASTLATLTLEDSIGSHWFVKLSKTTGGTYLEDGWQDFVEDNSICDYNFLVFGYDGNTCCNVLIFDKGSYQRGFVSGINMNQESAFSNGAKKRDESSESTPTGSVKKASKDDPGQCLPTFKPNGLKKAKIENIVVTNEPLSRTICSSSRRRPATAEEKSKVWEAAESFTTEFPYFRRCLTKSNVHRAFTLEIPGTFARAHGTHLHAPRKAEVTLWNTRGKAWRVNLVYTRGNRPFLSGGWKAFARANKLEEADICIFELVGKFEMRVHIFPAIKEVECATEEQI